jgi:pyruvate dehydrogenase E2 component (dihydrolipoamide acetyltransferase)
VPDDAPSVLPWRRRRPRVIPDGFVTPRRRGAGRKEGAGGNGAGAGEAEPAPAVVAPADERVPFNRVQARAAVALLASKHTSPHAHAIVDCDYSAVDVARAEHGARFRADEGFSLTYLPFVGAAVCRVLHEFPTLNATVGTDGDGLVVHRRVGLGIAVDLAHQGLVVPTVHDADSLSLRGLARAIHDLATRARAKQLKPDDLGGGTFTITNPGGYGTWRSFPIINQPEVAILSTDGVHKRVVADERGRLDIRPIGALCMSFDHRAVDGAVVGAFLRALTDVIECTNWATLV